MKSAKPLLFGTLAYNYLRKAILKSGNFDEGKIESKIFPDGERYYRILDNIANRDVILLGGTISDSDTLEIYDLSCAFVKYGARSLTLVIPYFAYSTMERAVKAGEVVTAKTRARLFSAIPQASIPNRILLVDLHSEGLPHYFEGTVRPLHFYAKSLIQEAIRELSKGGEFVLACTDAGRAKWVESLANDLNVKASFVFKKRVDENRTEVTAVSAQVKDKHVIIYDDMIRTGTSLINAAKAYRASGAAKISVVTTHGIFPGKSLEKIQKTGLFQSIICTDTHPRAIEFKGNFLKVKSIASLFCDIFKKDVL